MTTRLATQRNFIIATGPTDTTVVDRTNDVDVTNASAAIAISNVTNLTINDPTKTGVALLGSNSEIIHHETSSNHSTASTQDESFEFIDENHIVNAAGDLREVIIPDKIIETHTSDNGVAVISVVPLDASDVSNDGAHTVNMSDLSAIKDDELAQQIASGQLTVVQAPGESVDGGTPHYITVTVSAQDAGQNYQVQYLDTELYHSNSSQSQMTYPFCPVADYQTNSQSYYPSTTANYTTTVTNTPTTLAGSLPYLLPVEDSILLNTSSQSHNRDSPHSLTEVTYIQDPQSTPQTPTSTTNSLSGGSIINGNGGASSENEQSPLGAGMNTNKIASATIKWLSRNYETADGVSLPRSTLYNHYIQHCNENKLEPVNAASFGKLIRSVFSGLRTRRLGTRGNSKYHYYGIRIKPDSLLNHIMDDKPNTSSYSSRVNNSAMDAGPSGVSSSGNLNAVGNRNPKKLFFKPETYEACIQFLGDGRGAVPATFPHIELDHTFNSELTIEDVETFRTLYREQCESFLESVLALEFGTIEYLWKDFWRTNDNNNLDECEEEKFLSKAKLYLLCHCTEVQKFVKDVDDQFYQNMVDVIIPDVLRSIPNTLTQAIRNFAKNLEMWLNESMVGVPERLVQIKTSTISAFCQTLRRYTSLNHLAQAARAVLQNSTQIQTMLNDLNRVDFHNVQEQAAWVCHCDPLMVQRLENDFKAALQQQSSLEQWASWLQLVVDTALEEYRDKPSYPKAARQFLLKWSFYSSMIIRDLTLRSASSFGSFHLIRLLYDEYMFYLVEHKIAESQQKTAIAVISERVQKDAEFDFDCQFEFLQNGNEENLDSENAAKRLKQE